jgi:hypothetical protein
MGMAITVYGKDFPVKWNDLFREAGFDLEGM